MPLSIESADLRTKIYNVVGEQYIDPSDAPKDVSIGIGDKKSEVELLARKGTRRHLPNQGGNDARLVVVVCNICEDESAPDFHWTMLVEWDVVL